MNRWTMGFAILTLVALGVLFSPDQTKVYAQRQTTEVQLANNASSITRYVPSANDRIGAGVSYWHYCVGGGMLSFQAVAEESPDGVASHYTAISSVYGIPAVQPNGNTCAVIQAGGSYPYPAFNVLQAVGGTYSVWYGGTTQAVSTFPSATNSGGATTLVVADNSSQASLQFPAAPGTVYVQLVTTSLTGGSKSVYVTDVTESFNIAPTGGTGIIAIVGGTGTTCQTNLVTLWSHTVSAQSPQLFSFTGLRKSPQGDNVCLAVTDTSLTNQPTPLVSIGFANF